MLKPTDITDTRCTRKNSRHISYNINTPDKIVSGFLGYKMYYAFYNIEIKFLVKQNTPDYTESINF